MAVVVAPAVMSHWVLDLVVHTPDMPLWNDASLKLGLGLWNNAVATYLLEAALWLAGGVWLYQPLHPICFSPRSLSGCTPSGRSGREMQESSVR